MQLDGVDEDCGDLLGVRGNVAERRVSVVLQHREVFNEGRRDARRGGRARVGRRALGGAAKKVRRRPWKAEEAVKVAVVGALEDNDAAPPAVQPSQTGGERGRLGARVDKGHAVHADELAKPARVRAHQLILEAECKGGFGQHLDDALLDEGGVVAEEQGAAPSGDVDVLSAIRIRHVSTLGPRDAKRRAAPIDEEGIRR